MPPKGREGGREGRDIGAEEEKGQIERNQLSKREGGKGRDLYPLSWGNRASKKGGRTVIISQKKRTGNSRLVTGKERDSPNRSCMK